MRFALWAATLCLMLAMMSMPVGAQTDTISDEVYWDRLRQTSTLLDGTVTTMAVRDRQQIIDSIQALWTDVEQVRLSDERVIQVDVNWLHIPDSSDQAVLDQVKRRTTALLNRHDNASGVTSNAPDPLTLERILADERFQYDDEPEVSRGDALDFDSIDVPVLPGVDVLIVLVAVAVIALVVWYFVRGLNTSAVYPRYQPEDDPTTADAAQFRAAESEAQHDYRSAIRYLYLSSLLLLDETGVIHYDPTLTNREHLRQVARYPQIAELLRFIVQVFDRVWYGFWPVDAAQYEAFRQRVERLQQIAQAKG